MQQTIISIFFVLIFSVLVSAQDNPHVGPAWDFSHGPLKVSDDHRPLVHEDGTTATHCSGWKSATFLGRMIVPKDISPKRERGVIQNP